MSFLFLALAVLVWLGCGIVAAVMDFRDYDHRVVPGLDEAFRVLLVAGGPAGLAAELLFRRWRAR